MDHEDIDDSLTHIIPETPFPQFVDETVFLEIQDLLSRHPDDHVKSWHTNPRLYTLLRMLGYGQKSLVFAKFVKEKINDFWLPLGHATLNQLEAAVGISASAFRDAQRHILSRSDLMSADKLFGSSSYIHGHRYIKSGTFVFEELGKVGQGGSAEVVRVRHKQSQTEFACKRIIRVEPLKIQRTQLEEFEREVRILQSIKHTHCVEFVASFTDLASFSLILNPVASSVLKSMLERQSHDEPSTDKDISILRRSFACLSTAVAYLHQHSIRHKDIKPGNILIDAKGRVLLCDFGISLDWSSSEHSTTEGEPYKFTSRYCAPEVNEWGPRNTKSDIWSLGCVFMEIITVIKGHTIGDFNDFIYKNTSSKTFPGRSGLWRAPGAMSAWLEKMKSKSPDSADNRPLDWIVPMIRPDPKNRIAASDIVNMIHKDTALIPHPGIFIGSCCARGGSVPHAEAIDTPTLTNPILDPNPDALGIYHGAPSSPPHRHLSLPRRDGSPVSLDRLRDTPPNQNEEPVKLRDRSVSPRTQSSQPPRGSSDTGPPSTGSLSLLLDKSLGPVASRSDSAQTSNLDCLFPRARASIASYSSFRPSPVPPLASHAIKCVCAPRPNERHILNLPLASSKLEHQLLHLNAGVSLDTAMSTAESCPRCEIGNNRVQVYETTAKDSNMRNSQVPMIWRITRRLIVSYISGTPETRRCDSFWLPLADMQLILSGLKVTLRWSDCNQMTQRSSGNYSTHYDWLYNPKRPNNSLTLQFNDAGNAQQFIDNVCLPYEEGITVSHGCKTEVSPSTTVHVFEVGRRGVRNYRIAVVIDTDTDTDTDTSVTTSKLFVQWPEMDLDILVRRIAANDCRMTVDCKNVSTPTYHSDVRNEPAVDYGRVAQFDEAQQLKTNLTVVFPIGTAESLPRPLPGVVELLRGLTGWNLRYFGILAEYRSKRKRFGSKKHGPTNIMLWEKEVDDNLNSVRRRRSQLTLRQHEETDFIWTTAAITASTSISNTVGTEATLTVSNKARGKLLDVNKMTTLVSEGAVNERHSHSRTGPGANEGLSDLVLTFQDDRYRLEFVNIIDEFKSAAVVSAPLVRIPTRTASSVDSLTSPSMR